MDPREQLRRYLQQRRELGESELVLDRMTVDEVLAIVAGRGSRVEGRGRGEGDGEGRGARGEGRGEPASAADAGGGDWRAALREAGVSPTPQAGGPRVEQEGIEPAGVEPRGIEQPRIESQRIERSGGESARVADLPQGIVVGSTARELFGSPLSKLGSLDEIAEVVARCTRCPLYATATNPVPGEGNARAELVCVGEAPGANEDATGRPFVGQAGQLLTKILAAINLRREDVFICNVLKHRPPGNRNPAPEEVVACSPYLVQQLEVIRPKVIVAFGTFAAQTLLNTKLAIGKLRSQVHRYYGIPLIVTYHPAALLRNPAWKRPTWEDVQLARRILDDPQRP